MSFALKGDERWYLVHTQPNKHHQAEMHLRMQGFRTFLPAYWKTIRRAGRLETISAPLFSRYLFVALDLGRDRWLSIRSTIGVSSLVSCADRPIPAPAGVVEALMAQTDAANLTLFDGLPPLRRKVRVACGPFANFVGTLERLDNAGRVRVLIELMGSAVGVTLPRSQILPTA